MPRAFRVLHRFARYEFLCRLILHDPVRRQDTPPVGVRVNNGAATDDAARVENGVAADVGVVAQQGAEFAQTGVEFFAVHFHEDVPRGELEVGDFYACAKMGSVAENRVTDVIEVGSDGMIEQERVFDLAGISDDAVVADDDIFADIRVVANLAVTADDGGPFNHGAILDQGAFADKDFLADVGNALAMIVERGPEMSLEVALDFLQRLPGVLTAVKNGRVRGLAEIEQIRRFEHGMNLGKDSASRKAPNPRSCSQHFLRT